MDVRASPENKIHTSPVRVFKFKNSKILKGARTKNSTSTFFRESQNSVAEMNIFRLAGDMSHLLAIMLLLAVVVVNYGRHKMLVKVCTYLTADLFICLKL